MTATLARCRLTPINGDAQPRETGAAVDAQFNPTSLRMQVTNETRMGGGRGRQREQYLGASSTTLSFDLIYDTADEGTTTAPVNVRDRTRRVLQFLLPSAGNRQAPPRVRFTWGAFVYEGVVTSLTEDLDLFASTGIPLRAKLSVSIKEQRPEFAANQSGSGALSDAGATRPTDTGSSRASGGGAGPGGSGPPAPPPDRSAPAVSGESAADFAVRQGLDPAAWRAVASGVADPVALPGGLELDFSANLSASVGIGVSLGVEAGVDATLEASLGLDTRPAGTGVGFALAAAGGVQAALVTAAGARADGAAASARQAFGAAVDGGAGGRGSSGAGGAATATAGGGAPPGRPVVTPALDTRATTYASGVPVRPRIAFDTTPGRALGAPVQRLRPKVRGCDCRRGCGCGCGGSER